MNSQVSNYRVIAEFEFVMDLDFAMYSMIKAKYKDSSLVDRRLMNLTKDEDIRSMLIQRYNINLLSRLIPNTDTEKLYRDILDNHEEELLMYTQPYDSFRLLITFMKRATSIKDVTILCRNQAEEELVKKYDNDFLTVISSKEELDTSKYDVFCIKDFSELIRYKRMEGKCIYVAAAAYNFQKSTKLLNPEMVVLFSDINEIKLMDLYLNPKFHI